MRKCIFTIKLPLAVFFIMFMATLLSCSNKLGYGVVTWSMPEYNLTAGDIVPIYVRSNIEHVYIIGLNEQTSVRIEIPLWQLNFFESKKDAIKFQKKLEEYKNTYASVKLDGLPMRSEPDNSSKQVYRLRLGQTIKILWFSEGTPVLRGGTPIEGEWYKVLTNDGTQGWCFSHNLTIYDEREASSVADSSTEKITDEALEEVLNSAWYPENYRKMLTSKQVDLNKISLTWGFFPGTRSGVARIELKDVKLSFHYTKITKIRDKYQFDGASLSLQIKTKDLITLEFSDETGKTKFENFVTLNTNPEEIINNELKRREAKIAEIARTSPEFNSANFGVLKILNGGQFIWSGYNVISPSIIPSGAGASGKVSIGGFLTAKLKSDYDGVLCFNFEKAETPIFFMYSISSKGLRLEAVDNVNITENIVMRRSLNPVILFFAANGFTE